MPKKLPPGPVGLPIIGSLIPWLRNQPRFLLKTYRRYGDVVRYYGEFTFFPATLYSVL